MSIVKTINKSNHLAVTQVVDYVYCPRLLWLKMWTRFPRVESFGLLRGTNEHEVRRLLADSLKLAYQSCGVNALENVDYKSCIQEAIVDALKLGNPVSPRYYMGLFTIKDELSYRLELEEKSRLEHAIKNSKNENIGKIIEKYLPWKTEEKITSVELGITGIIDQLFKVGKNLIPLDFKTHTNRFAAFIWNKAHREQLILYSLLSEIDNPGYKANSAILELTGDLTRTKFKITKKDKKDAIDHIKQARSLLKIGQVPPKLSGPDAIKCSKCYLKDHCFSFEEEVESNC